MKTKLSKYDLLFPQKALLTSLRDLQEGKTDTVFSFLYRALVVKIDNVGGQLEQNPKKNPKNSIRARIISEPSPHAFLADDELPVFYPLFPYDLFPIKETEHVYVIFDGERGDHGIWISRIPEPFEVDDRNITPGIKKYQLDSEGVSDQDVQDSVNVPETINVSSDFQQEKVPKFTARVGDRVIEGSNNTLITLGRDRVSDVSSGQKEKSGAIHIVAGREKDENLDIENDLSTISICMSTDIDTNFKTDNVGSASTKVAAIGIRSDEIRIIARKGMKVVVSGGDLTLDANNIFLGNNSEDFVAQVNKVKSEIDSLKSVFNAHIHQVSTVGSATAQTGLAAPPTSQMQPTNELGSKTVKVKN